MRYPEIYIYASDLLYEHVSQHLQELWAVKGERMLTKDEVAERANEYHDAWQPLEKKTLEGICQLYGLEFYENKIDVFIAPWFGALCTPMIMGVALEPKDFPDLLTHELLHRLFTDNTSLEFGYDFVRELRKLFGETYSDDTLIHIPVHAGLKAIYLDVWKDKTQKLERDIADYDSGEDAHAGYRQAWEYVQTHDYKEINQSIKKLYHDLAERNPR